MEKKIAIGFITYGQSTAKYLPFFLHSLKDQTYKNLQVFILDNSEDKENENIKYLKENYPEYNIIINGKNIGFASGYNIMIKTAKDNGADYFLFVNPDMILDPEMIKILSDALDNDHELAAVSPKILKWDFTSNKKLNIIDSCGIALRPGLRFVDSLQNENNIDDIMVPEIIGPSGAAGLFRMDALDKVAVEGKYFDEIFFMYKEDCDLAYRLKLAGLRSKCIPEAVVYHDRSVSGKGEGIFNIALNRASKSRQAKKWSFVNQQMIYAKYWYKLSWADRFSLIWNQIKTLIFITLFEQYLFLELANLYRIRKNLKIYK